MGHLPFPPDAELTGPDRVVLSVLQKQYELNGEAPHPRASDSADDSDDSAVKHSEFVAPSPEGEVYVHLLQSSLVIEPFLTIC